MCTSERITILKEFLEIQDGDQTEVLRGKFKFDLQSESYRSILAIIHFYDAQ